MGVLRQAQRRRRHHFMKAYPYSDSPEPQGVE